MQEHPGVFRYNLYEDHDVLVDEVHFPESGNLRVQISPKLDFSCRIIQDKIRNRRPRLRRNTLFSGRKAGAKGPLGVPTLNRISAFLNF